VRCMTVHIKDGRATIPLWAAITIIVTILIAVISIVSLAKERESNAQHETLSNRISTVEEVVKAIPQIQKDISKIVGYMEATKK
jgi:hypothetical protein